MSKNVFLIVLEGGGDIQVRLVTETVWDWLFDDYVSPESYYYENVPEAVIEEFKKHDMLNYLKEGTLGISVGSWENDRAIMAPGFEFESVKEAKKFARTQGLKIKDTFDGCIY